MTMSQWFHYQRLIEYYKEEVARSHTFGALSFIMVGVLLVVGLFLITDPIVWVIMIIPMMIFIIMGITFMLHAQEAKDMIEYIKWRM